jgi:antitoxin component YwqK of YwqJK toxin-antitoxin module
MEVTLKHDDPQVEIYYRLEEEGIYQHYTTPILLEADSTEYEYISLYTYAKITIEGIDYRSEEIEYHYTPIVCANNEVLKDGECKNIFDGYSCPSIYDPSLPHQYGTIYAKNSIIEIADKDGDGQYEDYLFCIYFEYINADHLREEIPYVNYQKNGIAKSWTTSEYLSEVTTYANDMKNGLYQKYYYNQDQLQYERFYKNDVLDGLARNWYENGILSLEVPFVDGKMDGLEKTWYESGNRHDETFYKNGKKNGSDRDWTEAGYLFNEYYYVDGKVHGLQKSWYYDTDKLQYETYYTYGVIDLYKKYNYDGTLKECREYVNGSYSGSCMPE